MGVAMEATTRALRVVRKAVEADGICSFELAAPDGAPLPGFTAGAHVDVHLPGGLTRQYSLCNDPAETHRYRIAVLREPASRGGSAAMHDAVAEGSLLTVGTPRNLFPLAPGAQRHLLLAGGIGITPLLAMAEQLAREGADFTLHYAVRTRSRAAFLERLAQAPFASRVQLHCDDGPQALRLDLAALLARPEAGTHVYLCGPRGFIDAAFAAARAAHWPEAQLHHESFGAAPQVQAGDTAFELQLARSGRVIPVAAGQTALKALDAAGIFVPSACEQGVCGTCLTRVIDGVPEHRDQYLTPEEQAANDQFLPCCSRARSPRLVLDL